MKQNARSWIEGRSNLPVSTLLIVGLIVLAAAVGQAQSRPPLSDSTKSLLVDSVANLVERTYADADTGRMIAMRLRARLGSGAYRSATDWQHFLRSVTQDMQKVNGDTHLWVDVQPAPATVAAGGGLHGIEEVKRLSGNVGYMRISGFGGGEAALTAVEAALWQLSTTQAIIIDLRNSRGGSAGLSNFIISHFAPSTPVRSLVIYNRPQDRTTERFTLDSVPGPRRVDVPLFVLTDDITRSAAEDLAFVLQNMKRATIVGGRTAGAGRNNQVLSLPYGLATSISFTRVMEPDTRREWELVGVKPDVPTSPDSAFNVAHRLAAKAAIERVSDAGRRRAMELEGEVIAAAQRRPRTAPSGLARYAGLYEGDQRVEVRNGVLTYQPRLAQPRAQLVELSSNRFGDGPTRYEFLSGAGSAMSMRITFGDGSSTTYRRVATKVPVDRPTESIRRE